MALVGGMQHIKEGKEDMVMGDSWVAGVGNLFLSYLSAESRQEVGPGYENPRPAF